jgi:predicted alternative tryptophan synthase beta-subunit
MGSIENEKRKKIMKIVQTYASPEANTFDIIINDNVIAYYYEHFVNPETNEKLNTSVFEIYYDKEENDYNSSYLTEDFNDIEDIIESL